MRFIYFLRDAVSVLNCHASAILTSHLKYQDRVDVSYTYNFLFSSYAKSIYTQLIYALYSRKNIVKNVTNKCIIFDILDIRVSVLILSRFVNDYLFKVSLKLPFTRITITLILLSFSKTCHKILVTIFIVINLCTFE